MNANVEYSYFTVTWGAKASHGLLDFYKKEFNEDEFRVNNLFDQAKTVCTLFRDTINTIMF
jgi:hypothetical protein